jgi:hypothetical protein
MKSITDIGIAHFDKRKLPMAIRDVLSDLSQRRDVIGAVIVKGNMGIVACDLPQEKQDTPDMPEVLAMFENWGAYPRRIPKHSLFPQLVKDGNGFKVFAKRLPEDLTLFVIMRSSGYVGIDTLEIERTIKKIKESLGQ